jgi:hypothetical protein
MDAETPSKSILCSLDVKIPTSSALKVSLTSCPDKLRCKIRGKWGFALEKSRRG